MPERYRYEAVPFGPEQVKYWTILILRERSPSGLNRGELVQEAYSRHLSSGGLDCSSDPVVIAKKPLAALRGNREIESINKGYYRLAGPVEFASEAHAPMNSEASLPIPLEEPAKPEENPSQSQYPEVGCGKEAVYCFYHPHTKELAEHKGQKNWECKIGMTRTDVERRVREYQSQKKVDGMEIGLVIRTEDSQSLERILHEILKFIGRHINQAGSTEYFYTSPSEVQMIYYNLQLLSQLPRHPG